MASIDRSDPIDLEALLPVAVRAALKHQSLDRFVAWAGEALPHFLAPEMRRQLEADGNTRLFAHTFARSLWKSLPLPRLDYRPEKLPEVGRNDPCPCGSGRKHKQCCLGLEQATGFNVPTDALWPFVLDELPAKEVSRLAELKRLSLAVLVQHAETLEERGASEKAIRLLEPRIAPPWSATDEDAEAAFDMLCDLYDESGRGARKRKLIDAICQSAPRSRLRSAAWGRLAAVQADHRQWDEAWQCFRRAVGDDPANLSLGALEMQLLTHQGRTAEARERGQFWAARARRAGSEHADFAGLLSEMANDPDAALGRTALLALGPEVERLKAWAERVVSRPVAPHVLEAEPGSGSDATTAESLAEMLRGMGIDESQIPAAVQQLEKDMEKIERAQESGAAPDDSADEDTPDEKGRAQAFLCTPPDLAQLEQRWRDVFPLSKPLSTQDAPMDAADAWEPRTSRAWIGFLEDHPEAADDFSILDDVVTAVHQLEPAGQPWFDDLIERPLLERSRATLERALQEQPEAEVPWPATQNRPALRNLARLYQVQATRDAPSALPLAQRLLRLNPNDNHGFRSLVMNGLLAKGDDAAALDLAATYPDDTLVDMRFGRALALFRSKQLEAATLALREAIGESPKVPRYLIPEEVRQPKLSTMGISAGGADEAWYYREEARELWEQTPGALEWLKQVERRVRPVRRGR